MYRILLSPYSKIFYSEWKLDQNRSDYNIVFDQNLEGKINITKLNDAIKRLISDYVILNSHVEDKDGELYWVKNKKIYELEYFGPGLSSKAIFLFARKPFDLEVGPLYRFSLVRVKNKYRFIAVLHHIVIDGRSVNYFLNKLSNYYNDKNYKVNVSIKEQISSLSKVSNELTQYVKLTKEKSKAFWRKRLVDFEPLNLDFLKLQVQHNDKQVNSSSLSQSNIGEVKFNFGKKVLQKLDLLRKNYTITPYLYSKIIFAVLLHKYTSQNKFCISYPIAIKEGLEFIHGACVNTNLLPFDFSKTNNLIDLINQAKNYVLNELSKSLKLNSINHKYLPIIELISISNKRFLDIFFVQVLSKDQMLQFNNIKIKVNNTRLDISGTLLVEQESSAKTINYRVRYKLDKIDTLLLNKFIECYKRLFLEILDELVRIRKTIRLKHTKSYDLLSQEQYQQIIHRWNDTDKGYSNDKTIHELFEEQVERSPDSIAVIYEKIQLTYRELNERSNKLAAYIRQTQDIKPDTLIALCLDRGEHMLIGILAVLKAGGAYVPIDPNYPDERIKYILEDTGSKMILTNEIHTQRLEGLSQVSLSHGDNGELSHLEVIAIDSAALQSQLCLELAVNLNTETTSANLAYVIYTSGTTGNPKGVMIEHKGIVNRINWMNYMYPLNSMDKILQKTPYVFDVSVWELFWASWYGACLIFTKPERHKDTNYIIDLIDRELITITHFVPSMLSIFEDTIRKSLEQLNFNTKLIYNLKYIFCSGEPLSLTQVKKCHKILPNTEIQNLYGPTEASIDVLYYNCSDKYIKAICIGRQIHNVKAYVLNSNLTPLPIGAVGELHIGGIGLARGYLNRPELTAEKFIANPFQSEEERKRGKNSRIYRTGDLVRWLSDGSLEYIGRNDSQVKIRGYRIELGEIENVLSSYDGIKQCVVLTKERSNNEDDSNSNRYLVGYYISDNKLDELAILNYLQSKLPEYMIPTVLVHLRKLPLTINGKLDRKGLPDPKLISSNSYIAPRNELEKQVCRIWAEVFNLSEDKVSIHDDFFKLGGDSIVSIQVVSKLRQRLGLNSSVKDIFSYRSIARLCDNVLNKVLVIGNNNVIQAEQGVLSGEVELLPIQEWFFENNFAVFNHWNQSFLLRTPNLDLTRLQISVGQLIKHHDAFRLRYKKAKDKDLAKDQNINYIQYYNPKIKAEELKILDIRTLKAEEDSIEFIVKLQEIFTNWQNEFNIEKGPIYNIGYIHGYADGSSRIWFALHHLIVDTVSWRILAEDLKDLYHNKTLGIKGSSYRQWVNAVRGYVNNHEEERVYWNDVLVDYDINNSLNRLVVSKDTSNCTSLKLSIKQTNQLLQRCNRAYNTEINDILLTALGYTLTELTGSRVNHIILEGHGREEIDSNIDVSRTLGWFTSMYPVRLEISDELDNSIKRVKENLRRIPNKGIGYGLLIGYKKEKLPRISFNYLGQLDKKNQTFWNIIAEGSGIAIDPENEDYNIININGMVINGELQFSIASKLDQINTTEIARTFKQKLESIINYTVSQTRSYLTVSDIGNIINQDYLDKLQENREIEGVYLANSLQQGFIYHALNQGEVDDAYRVQLIWQYNNYLDIEKLQEAWKYAQKRYTPLRLRLAWEDELVQIIDKKGVLDWRYMDLSTELEEKIQALKIKQIQKQDRFEPYKLGHGNLFRIYIIRQKEDLYTCIFSNHHTILDGWSNPILLDYVHETYLKLLDNRKVEEIVDQSYECTQKYLQEHQNDNKYYWDQYVSYAGERSNLSCLLSPDSKYVKISEYKHIKCLKDQTLKISKSLYKRLKKISEEGVTLNAILQYVWHKILNIYGSSNQTIVGTTVSGRNLPIDNIEKAVGLYINTVPLIFEHSEQTSKNIIESIKTIQDNINEANSRSNVNLTKLQKGGERLFDSLFIYENYPTSEDKQDRLNISTKKVIEKLDYPLGVIAYESIDELIFNIKYAGELFSEKNIENILLTARTLLEQISLDPSQKAQALNYLNQEQYQQIIHRWNDTDKGYSNDKTIHELFEEQVERSPDSIAVIYEKIQLTYRELNERSNKLAAYIRQTQDIKPDTLIALCLDRGEHMLIGILAVLKAGGAYVPIDPNYPDERIKYILEDTGSKMILTNEIHTQRLEGLSQVSLSHGDNGELSHLEVIAIDSAALQSQLCLELAVNLNTETTSANLAYVIYTSGTTGNPKGVLQLHSNVIRLFTVTNLYYEFNSHDVWTLFHSYVFDFSVWEIWGAFIYGGRLVVPSYEQIKELESFYKLCKQEKVTILNQTPTAFYQFRDIAINKEIYYRLNNLKYVILGGEMLNISQLNLWFNYYDYDQPKLINMYGITETTVHVTYNLMEKSGIQRSSCIGRQIHNVKAYVLNSNLTPLPIGAVGELHIGGIGLARGYLNRPELTAEKFIANPFQSEEERKRGKNSRIYRTGDLVRWLSDGSLEYIGRNDSQVKIRGYRIELGEIENVLSSYDGIKQCVVLTKERSNNEDDSNSNRYLVGYYISDNKLDELAILNYLQSKLPEYMIPTVLVHLRKLPLTINGKLDRKGLPDPKLISSNSYIAPRNELEKQVCRIWAEVFNLSEDKVSIHDDFFKLGGDSIVSIQVVSKLRQRLGLNSSVKDIFSYRSIARLCDNVLNKVLVIGNNNVIQAEQGVLSGEVELLPIQEWFFENNFAVFNHWNQSFLLRTPNLDLTRLQISVGQLIKHHDAFRLRYKKAKDKDLAKDQNINYIQYYNPKIKAEELKILDIRTLKAEEDSIEFIVKLQEIFTNWQNEFNIEKGPIYNIGYIHGYADGSSRIWFALHHLIVDTVSWRILAEDLKDLYHNKTLGIKGSSYRQWVNAVRGYVNNHEEERVYWNDVLVDYDINNSLNRLVVSKDTSNCTSLKLSIKQTNQLLQRCNRAYNTEINDILLTALGYTLTELTGSRVNHIILEGHGREEIDSNIDVSRTLGWFTSMYPVRLEISDELDNSIKRVKENLRRIPNKGIGYGLLIGYKKEKLPRISFNYLGQLDKKNQTFWNIIAEGSGIAIDPENEDYNIININGMVINGELQFSIASKLDQINTTEIARTFKQKLESIINYTVSQTRSYLTVSDIGNIINQDYLDKLQENREIEGVYLANSLQQGFIYHALNQGEVDDAYRVQLIWQYNNYLDIEKLQEAWKYAQKRYTPLRLRLAWEDELVQIIDKKGVLDWRYMDLSTELEEKIQALKIKQIQKQDRFEPYKLGHGNLFRIYIIRQKEDLYTCIFSNHHTILDGWSNPILLDYVHETYLKLLDNRKVEEIVDQSYECTQKYLQEHQNDNKYYWDQYVSYAGERSNLSCLLSPDSKYVKISEYKHIKCLKDQTLKISKSLYKRLKKISEEGVTLNAILQYVWHKILNIYGSSNQTIVGTTVSGRNLPIDNIEKAVGLYINTVPLIFEHSEQTSKNIIESIKTIQDNINEANSRSNVNLTKLQKGGERLFDSLFIYENYPTSEDKQDRLNISTKKVIEKLDYPLGVIAYESIDELIFNIKYAGELFSEKNIENILLTARTLLEQISLDPSQKAQALNYLNQEQYQQIIHRWNDTDKGYSNDKTIHELFEEQVERSPDSIAVIYEKIQLTYRELNERSNKLAAYIRQTQDIKPDTLIALCLDRGEHMLIGILAVLKAGGAYVPIDPNYPDERIKYILEDTGSKMILTNEIHTQRLEGLSQVSLSHGDNGELSHLEVIAIDSAALQSQLCLELAINLNTETTSANLAYVIYTSGTTGNPKGVMIEHKAYTAIINSIKNLYFVNNQKIRVYSITNYVFDIFGLEYGLALLNGGLIYLFLVTEHNSLDCSKFDMIQITPSLFESKLDYLITSLHTKLFIGGENLRLDLLNKTLDKSVNIVNMYGPTETTVWSTSKLYQYKKDKNLLYVELGKSFDNVKAYVLNSNLTPLPIGAVGELHIGGIGLARGYLNRPELTAEKFIANPFQSEEERKRGKNSRIYRTGDLVRWLSDGSLEYIGRNDSQVKIRGYRIELGEIENVLSSYDGIKQCVVLTKERSNNEDDSNSNRYLVGYYISDNKLDELAILNYLQSKLPEYMIPTVLVHLRKLPLTINGKLDRKGLPDPKLISSNSYIAPRNELEKQVCRIWAEVFNLSEDKVSIHDDFFKLGGDSIVSIQVVSKLRQRLGLNSSVKDIFSYRSIARLCDNVLNKVLVIGNNNVIQAEQGVLSGEVELLPIQEWFFENNFAVFNHWNQSFLLRTPNLDLTRLQISVGQLIKHHDAFRLRYKKAKDKDLAKDQNINYIQYYNPKIKAEELKILDIRTLKAEEDSIEFIVKLQEIFTNWQNEFNIEKGPIYNIGYIHGYADGSSRIWFALHHLIVDTVSWRILAEDLKDLYHNKTLGIKGSSYRQWVNAVRGYVNNHEEERVYWNDVLVDYDINNSLNRLVVSKDTSNCTSLKLSIKQTNQLLQRCNRAYNTEINDILLTALGYTLTELTGSRVNHIILEGHGREEIDSNIDVSRTLGWFTSMYPVRLEISDELDNSIKRVKENLRRIPNKGIGYGLLIGYKKEKLPRISFNYLGQLDKKNQTFWNIIAEGSGIAIDPENEDYNIININGMVINGELQFSIASKLDQINTTEIARTFKQKLESIITYCIRKPNVEYTVSDFQDFEPYVIFNKGIVNSNIFIFPPENGGAESYFNNIVPKLTDKRLILFNNYYYYLKNKLGVDYVNNITYENLANEYIYFIKSIQSKGPYNLFGWSFGGVLAFEIGKQLIDKGNIVANIILIDPFFNYKIAISKTQTNVLEINSINYRYLPSLKSRMLDTNILLFKSVQKTEYNLMCSDNNPEKARNLYKIFKYYAEDTKYNHLDDILDLETLSKIKKFKIEQLNCDHFSWLKNKLQIVKICNLIQSVLIKNSLK